MEMRLKMKQKTTLLIYVDTIFLAVLFYLFMCLHAYKSKVEKSTLKRVSQVTKGDQRI